MLKKILAGALAALTVVGAAGAAQADGWHGGGWRGGGWHGDRHYDRSGALIGAGVLGLAVGAAIAGGERHHDYYYGGAPAYYYGPPPVVYGGPAYYAYDDGCRVHWRWDPYWRRYVEVERCY